ncbi:SDR family oxidoreductase [Mucilaginibacter psychrotolerans]|uniref:SDR family oxidoreductase n=1 Tax=Mucilaginibacter psychrotolerans TaxID=1524096 RepID=A0A4Y8S2F9_9SPHI|nr:SDR family oxidoreductase [Mucilaginibacter psychrotolerans]TFF33248.1 SDR family oxidoreductase [Mucilaginibacter psychrotolerans]
MTISILGCGWYGLALAKALVADGIKVKGSTTSAEKLTILANEGITPFLVDLSDGSPLNADFFEADILLIAIPPKARSGAGSEYVPKLQRVIDAIGKSTLKKVILISSTGVYADLNGHVDEQTPPQPNTLSGQVLFGAEELFRQQTGFKTTIIRFGGLVGPGRDPARFFAGKKDIPNGLAPINLIHLDDCIGITKAIIAQDIFGITINAVAPHHPEKAEFYTMAAAKSGLELPVFLPELKEWKVVDSVAVGQRLHYIYEIPNWYEWLS